MPDPTKTTCPNCGQDVPEGAVTPYSHLTKCGRCHALFSLQSKYSTGSIILKERDEPPAETIKVIEEGGELIIHQRWKKKSWRLLIPFFIALAGNILLYVILPWDDLEGVLLLRTSHFGNYIGVMLYLVLILVGFIYLYGTVLDMFNRTEIKVNRQRIFVRHRPFPIIDGSFFKGREIQVADLNWLFVEASHSASEKVEKSWEMLAEMKSGERIMLAPYSDNKEELWFIERKIERFLEIPDGPA